MMMSSQNGERRSEHERLLRAVRQRLELEKTFGITYLTMPPRTTAEASAVSPAATPKTVPAPAAVSAPATGSNAEALAALRKECEQCLRCELARTRTNMVFGSGNPDAELMFVGEAPGEEEDRQGEPFVGKAGQLLTKMIEAMGLKRSEVYICNILKSRPPGNRTPLPHEIANCMPFLKRQIRTIRPRVICALGATAAKSLLGTDKPIGQLRGRFFDFEEGVRLLPTFHPSYLLRSPWEKAKAWEDLKKVRDALKEPRGEGRKPDSQS